MGDQASDAPRARYEETDEDDFPEAFCLMAVQGSGIERLLEAFGAEPTPVVDGTFDEAWDLVDGPDPESDATDVDGQSVTGLLQFIDADGWTIVVDAGAFGTSPRIIEAASEGGVCAAFSTDINAHMHVALARDGLILRAFDPLLDISDVGEPLPEESDLPFGDPEHDPYPASLLLIERWTTCVLPSFKELFQTARPVYRYAAP